MKNQVWTALPLRYRAKVRLLEFCPLGEASSLILKFGQRLGGIQSRIHGCDGCAAEHAVKALTLSASSLT